MHVPNIIWPSICSNTTCEEPRMDKIDGIWLGKLKALIQVGDLFIRVRKQVFGVELNLDRR